MASRPHPFAASPATLWIIHLCFLLSVPIYAVVTRFSLMPSAPPPSSSSMVALTLVFISLVEVPLGFFIPTLLRPSRTDHGWSPAEELAFNQIRLIISDALFESIAVYGMVSIFVGGSQLQIYGLMALSLVLLALNTIRLNGWVARYNERLRLEQAR